MNNELPRPEWMSKKHREYLQRLMVRKGVLDVRLATTQLRDPQEITKELHALEWAIERLTQPEEVSRSDRALALLHSMMQLYICNRGVADTLEKAKSNAQQAEAWASMRLEEYGLTWEEMREAFQHVHAEEIARIRAEDSTKPQE